MGSGDSGCLKMFLVGCGFVIFVAVLVTAGGVYLVTVKRAEIASFGIEQATNLLISESGLSQDEQEAMKAQVARLTEKIRSKELGFEHFQLFGEMLEQGPLPGVVLLQALRQAYLEKRGMLTEEEEQKGRRSIERFQRGLLEGSIATDRLSAVLGSLEKKASEGSSQVPGPEAPAEQPMDAWDSPRLEEELTVADLQKVLSELQAVVEESGVPDEPYQVRIADEFRKVVDQVLESGRNPAGIQEATGSVPLESGVEIFSTTASIGEVLPATP